MSRLGKSPIVLPKNVEVKTQDGQFVVKGPKGTLSFVAIPGVSVEIDNENRLFVSCDEKLQPKKTTHGLYRATINNMIIGVSAGFEKKLLLIGVGYRAAVQGQKIDLQIGYSHPTQIEIPKGLAVEVDKSTTIIIKGIDKQVVGQFAATIRATRPPEPYKGKGIRYEKEFVRKKAGKAAKGKGA